MDKSEKKWQSKSIIHVITEERQYEIDQALQKEELFMEKQDEFKNKNKDFPESKHYIYLGLDKNNSRKDKVDKKWFKNTILKDIIDEVCKDGEERVRDVYQGHFSDKIREKYALEYEDVEKAGVEIENAWTDDYKQHVTYHLIKKRDAAAAVIKAAAEAAKPKDEDEDYKPDVLKILKN